MALGIPTVATAVGANFRVIENGVSGFLAKDEKEWIEIFKRLLSDPLLRKRIGLEGRQRVKKLFSIEATKDIYLDILDQLINK
jgi:glycosyltransferase involved in cell wall biosynthesis